MVQLAKMANVSQSGLSSIINDAVSPKENTMQAIAKALDCTMLELLGLDEGVPCGILRMIKGTVPLVGDIACGTPILAQENITAYVDTPEGVHADFALRCSGDSMYPTFNDGDIVLIRQDVDVANGQIAAVLIDDEATLKRIQHLPDGVILIPDNTQKYSPIILQGEEARNVRILGVAVSYTRILS